MLFFLAQETSCGLSRSLLGPSTVPAMYAAPAASLSAAHTARISDHIVRRVFPCCTSRFAGAFDFAAFTAAPQLSAPRPALLEDGAGHYAVRARVCGKTQTD